MMNHQINIGFETEVADENSVRELIRTCAERVLTSEQVDFDAEIDVTVVDADAIREMNAEYRNKDAVTDVLSFRCTNSSTVSRRRSWRPSRTPAVSCSAI